MNPYKFIENQIFSRYRRSKGFFHDLRLFVFSILVLMLIGCTGITQADAEAKAKQFVNQNVKFFVSEENSTTNLSRYNVDSLTTYQEDKNWVVVMHVSAKVSNETKKNDLVIKLNNKGDVVEFNGQKVSK